MDSLNNNRHSKLLNYPNYENQNITLLNYMSSKKYKNQTNCEYIEIISFFSHYVH
jgi:hypothetical protein